MSVGIAEHILGTMPDPSARSKLVRVGTPATGPFDFHIHTENDRYISQELERDGIWEPFETEIFSRLCRPGEFILDIGANIGWYTAVGARLVGPSGLIHAFEPDPVNFALLRRNMELFEQAAARTPRIDIFNTALADASQTVPLYLSPSNRGDHNLFASHENRQSIPVAIRTLDELLLGKARLPTLLKCDTQGSEARILRGAGQLLAQGWRPDMILEFWPYGLNGAGDEAATLWRELDERGYITFKLVEQDPRLTRLGAAEIAIWLRDLIPVESRWFINLLCLHRTSERFAALSDLIDDGHPHPASAVSGPEGHPPLSRHDLPGEDRFVTAQPPLNERLAESDYDARILLDPDGADAWAGKARIRLEMEDYPVAVECAIAALARAPEDPACGRLLIEAAANGQDRDLLALAAKRQKRLFPGDRIDQVPEDLLNAAPDDAENLEAFRYVLATIRDRRPRRYVQLLQCLAASRPRSILEVGVFNSWNAMDMIRAGGRSPAGARHLRYIGFDLFEAMTPEIHEKEFSKFPQSRAEIAAALSTLNQNHQLVMGYTQESLAAFRETWDGQEEPIDFVFLDGGHSEETIQSDWDNIAPLLTDKSVVMFDDYYVDKVKELDGFGCNTLIERLAQDPRYRVEMLPIQDCFDKDFGTLTISLVKLRLRPRQESPVAPEPAIDEDQEASKQEERTELTEFQAAMTGLRQMATQIKDILIEDANIRYQTAHPNPLNRFGRKCFSQSDEDGITLEILRRLDIGTGTFLEFGVGDGLENNTIILGSLGWRGLWLGGQELAFDPAPLARLHYIRNWITRDNAVGLAQAGLAAMGGGVVPKMVDLISLDLDGNDIYIAEALLTGGFRPKIFIAEYNAKFPPPARFQIAYDPDHRWAGTDYFGAALQNFADLFRQFDYKLICCNGYSGANAFFIRQDLAGCFPEVPDDIRDIHVPPRYHLYSAYGHKPSARTVETIFSQ